MTLKAITDSIDDLPEALQSEYEQGEDGKYYLALDQVPDEHPSMAKALKAKKHEQGNAKEQKKRADDLQKQLDELTEERDNMLAGAVPKDDVEKLENSYKAKLTKRENELNAQIESMQGNLRGLLVDNKAQAMASQLSDYPDVLMPHIKSRLQANIEDGAAETRVLDAEGNVSADTVDDLAKEIAADKRFAPIIRGSQASGGGAENNGPGNASTKADLGDKQGRAKAIGQKYPELEA